MVETLTRQDTTTVDTLEPVLAIPGVSKLIATQKSERLTNNEPALSFEQELLAGIETITAQLDAEVTAKFIPQYFSWTQEQTTQFFDQPGREPFSAGVDFSEDEAERYDQCVAIGRYLKKTHDQAAGEDPNSDEASATRQALSAYIDTASMFLFDQKSYAIENEIYGVDDEARRTGKVAGEIQELFKSQANLQKPDDPDGANTLMQQALDVTEGGNLRFISSYLKWYTADPDTRAVLESVWHERMSNSELIRKQLRLFFEMQKFHHDIGISPDTYNALNQFTTTATIAETLQAFLLDPQHQNELEAAYKVQTGSDFTSSHEASIWDIYQQLAAQKKYPPEIATIQQMRDKVDQTEKDMLGILPPTNASSSAVHIEPTLNFGANSLAVGITYKSAEGKRVFAIGVNPRTTDVRLKAALGHELTHTRHAAALEEQGLISAFDKTPIAIIETFSQLIEDQVHAEALEQTGEKPESNRQKKELTQLLDDRELAIHGLFQNDLRMIMENQLSSGKTGFSDGELDTISSRMQLNKLKYEQLGIPIAQPNLAILSLNPLFTLDGTAYLASSLPLGDQTEAANEEQESQSTEEQQTTNVGLEDFFSQKFGTTWLGKKEAISFLYTLMASSADVKNTQDLLLLAANLYEPQTSQNGKTVT